MTHKSEKPDSQPRQGTEATLVRAEIELAYAFLGIAAVEAQLDSSVLAAEFLEGAILSHKNISRHLAQAALGTGEPGTDLREAAQRLFDAIVSTERQLQVLQTPPRRAGGVFVNVPAVGPLGRTQPKQ